MDVHEHKTNPGKNAMKTSGNTSMILTAFGFMILMLIITAPVTGPPPGPLMDHGPGPFRYNGTDPGNGFSPVLFGVGNNLTPDPDRGQVRIMTNLSDTSASGTNL